MRQTIITICLTCFLAALGGCNYEDGPVISLRSKGRRMDFYRPMTYYENNGIDSTDALNQRFADSIPEFEGRFYFRYEAYAEVQGIFYDKRPIYSTSVGSWLVDGFDDFERISVYIKGSTWPDRWWTITRLTNRKLWLEGPGGRLLRFEE